MNICTRILPIALLTALIASISAMPTDAGTTNQTDTGDRAVKRSTEGQEARRATPRAVPKQIETELAEPPAPFKREWFYFNDKPVMFNKLVTQIGDKAPDLAVDNWRGEQISLKHAKGDIVVLNFWATWCGPCKAVMPTMNKVSKEYAEKGVHIVGICDDQRGAENFEQVCEQYSVGFPVALDTGDRSTGQSYGRLWFPFLVIVDREGVIRAKGINPDHLKDALDALLAEQPAETS